MSKRLLFAPVLVALFVPASAEIIAKKDGNNLRVEVDGALFTEYRSDRWLPCLYPLMSPSGTHLTRQFPFAKDVPGEESDHPHHVGFWFTHGSINGSDYWHGGKDGSKVVTVGFAKEPVVGKSDGGGDELSFSVDLEWVGKDGKVDLEERRDYRITVAGMTRVIDVACHLKAADDDVVFGDTKEGSFAIRVAPTLRHKGEVAKGHIVNSKGDKDGAAWGKRAEWVAYHGPDSAGNKMVIALMDKKGNIHHPTWWHARDYGLLAANPFGPRSFKDKAWKGKGGFTLKSGESRTQSYRLVLHQGDLESAGLESHWRNFNE